MSGKYKDNETMYHINQIKIMMRINRKDKDFTPFTFKMLSHPDLAGLPGNYTYPYFTNSVSYPYAMLANRDYKYIVEFFFDRDRFEKIIRKYGNDPVDENDLYDQPEIMNDVFDDTDAFDENTRTLIQQLDENTEHNIDCMLKLLFPISSYFSSLYTNTFQHKVSRAFNMNVFNFDFKRPFWSGNVSYIKHDSTEFIVSGVTWLNDVLNHPVYFKFLQSYYKGLLERKKNGKLVNQRVLDKYYEYANYLFPLFNNASNYVDTVDKATYDDIKKKNNLSENNVFADMFVELSILMKNARGTYANTSQTANLRLNILNELLQRIKPFAKDNADIVKCMTSTSIVSSKKLNRKQFISELNNTSNTVSKSHFRKLANAIIQTYLELQEYNRSSDYKINLKQQFTTHLSKLYELSIAIKAVEMVDDFINLRLRKLDMNTKNKDETDKSKEELDIIKYINANYSEYAKLSNTLNTSIADVTRPTRETSNILLRNEINKIRLPTVTTDAKNASKPCDQNSDFFRDVYRKYFHPDRRTFQRITPFNNAFMYVGVSTLGDVKDENIKDEAKINEIYVLVDVVNRKKYETKKHRCKLQDDRLLNTLNNLLSARNDAMVGKYREYTSFDNAVFDDPEKSTETQGAAPVESKKTGGVGKPMWITLTRTRRRRNI
jgi:hypothetical protein